MVGIDEEIIEQLKVVGASQSSGQYLKRILELFIMQASENIEDLADCILARDSQRLSHAAHKLIGTASAIGASGLAGQSASLYAACKGPVDFGSVEVAYGDIISTFRQTIQVLERELSS